MHPDENIDCLPDGMTFVHSRITDAIIGAAIEVHKTLGPGLLESAYESCLAHELIARGLSVRLQVSLPVQYKGQRIDCGYRIDMIVDDAVVVEVKAVEKFAPIHEAQLITYLRLSGFRVGLILNFNVRRMTDGIMRRVL